MRRREGGNGRCKYPIKTYKGEGIIRVIEVGNKEAEVGTNTDKKEKERHKSSAHSWPICISQTIIKSDVRRIIN